MTVQPPLVSAIVPAYNAARFLPATLDALLGQTHQAIEVVVVDDGSRDASPEVVEAYARRDARVRLVRQTNAGVAAARNEAGRVARGEFLAPCDADDLWAPRKIELQLERMLAGGERMGMVYNWWVGIDEAGRVTGTAPRPRDEGYVLAALLMLNFIGNASVPLFRRSAFDAAGGYVGYREQGAQGCEDWDITLRIAERYDVGVVPRYLVGYRAVDGSMSRNVASMYRSYDLMVSAIRARHPEFPAHLFTASRGHILDYLSNVCHADGRIHTSLCWRARTVMADPTVLMSISFAMALGRGLARLALEPVIRSIWRDPLAWKRFRAPANERKRRRRVLVDVLPGAYETCDDGRPPSWDRPMRDPHALLMRRRTRLARSIARPTDLPHTFIPHMIPDL